MGMGRKLDRKKNRAEEKTTSGIKTKKDKSDQPEMTDKKSAVKKRVKKKSSKKQKGFLKNEDLKGVVIKEREEEEPRGKKIKKKESKKKSPQKNIKSTINNPPTEKESTDEDSSSQNCSPASKASTTSQGFSSAPKKINSRDNTSSIVFQKPYEDVKGLKNWIDTNIGSCQNTPSILIKDAVLCLTERNEKGECVKKEIPGTFIQKIIESKSEIKKKIVNKNLKISPSFVETFSVPYHVQIKKQREREARKEGKTTNFDKYKTETRRN